MLRVISLLFVYATALGQAFTFHDVAWPTGSPISSFDPSQLSGMVIWTSITNGVTNTSAITPPSNNDNIQGWADMSGNNFPLLKLGTVRPVYHSSGGANNSAYLSFSGSTSCSMTNATGGASQAFPLVYFLVMNFAGGGSGQGPTICSMSDLNPYAVVNGTTICDFIDNGAQWNPNNVGFNQVGNTVWFIWTIKMNTAGATTTTRTNGVTLGSGFTGAMGTLPSHGVTLGNYFNSSLSCGMQVSEFIWYSGNDMSSSDMHKVEQYLASKYAITIP